MNTTTFDARTGVLIERPMTPGEVAAWEAEQTAYVPPVEEPVEELSPLEKLTQFLKSNPDVAKLLK